MQKGTNPLRLFPMSQFVNLAAELLQERKRREQWLDASLFGEPAWEILLELFVALHSGMKMSVSDACYASGAPPTTGLRYLDRLEKLGLIYREADRFDHRRIYVNLTAEADQQIFEYLADLADRRGMFSMPQ